MGIMVELLRQTKTIAVVGLTPGRESEPVAKYLQEQGYRVIPVNPQFSEVLGERSYPDLDSVPVPADIVNVFRRPEYVGEVVEAAVRLKAKAVWMQLHVVNEAAADAARRAGLHVVMDKCIHCEHKRLREMGEL